MNSERKKAIKEAIEEVEKTINEEFDAKLLEVKQNSIPNAASFVGGTLLAPPQEQPPAELATNTSKTMEHASAPPVPSSSDRDATHEIETGELSLESGPQPESEPQQKPEHEPESQPEPDPQQEPEPQSEFPASTTNASNEPDDPFIAHEYKIVDTSDTSAAKRKRTRLRIHAPTARTPSALIATAMEAAVEVQNTHQSQFVSVFVHAEDDPRSEMLAQGNFAPDGCGVSGDACTGDMWFSATSVAELPAPRQSAIFEAAKKNEDSFKKVVIHEIDGDAYDVLMGEVKPLYDELMLMKDEERFRTVGFSAAGPYNRWLLDVQRLTGETDELQLLRNWNITVGELLQMGMDYLDSKGSETTQTKHARELFSLAFTSRRGESKQQEPDEEALLQYLAEEFDSSPQQIKATIRETLTAYLDRRSVEIPEHMRSKGALTNEQREDMTCRMDLQCWGDKHSLEATFACQGYVESLALHTHEWTDGFLESKFSHFRWSDSSKGVVTYMGDKIMFQNGFGAWVPHRYWCDYDALNKQVLDVRAQSGRM